MNATQVEKVTKLIIDIGAAFGNVSREDGVTLHETEVLDDYGSDQERQAARAKDTDAHWRDVLDEWIEEIRGIGGMCFLDGEGFRYYLPAYMTWYLKKWNAHSITDAGDTLLFCLSSPREDWDFNKLFSSEQKNVIRSFLQFVVEFDEDNHADAQKALDSCWSEPSGK